MRNATAQAATAAVVDTVGKEASVRLFTTCTAADRSVLTSIHATPMGTCAGACAPTGGVPNSSGPRRKPMSTAVSVHSSMPLTCIAPERVRSGSASMRSASARQSVAMGVTGVMAAVMSGPAFESAARMDSRMAAKMAPASANNFSSRASTGGRVPLRTDVGDVSG
jgi:hypothetical protein